MDTGLETIAFDTFEELKRKKYTPTACCLVAAALMNNPKQANGPYKCALPERYYKLTYLERHA